MSWECPKCDREFSSENALRSHHGQMHSGCLKAPPEKVAELYQSGLTMQEVADTLEVSRRTVVKRLEVDRPWRDEDRLRELYEREQLTLGEVADELGCSEQTVSRWLRRHGIETRHWLEEAHRVLRERAPPHRFTRDGYEIVETTIDNSTKAIRIHRLVAVAEHGFDEVAGKIVHHKNGVPWDNRPENLEVMTSSQHGRIHNPVNVRWGNATPRDALEGDDAE